MAAWRQPWLAGAAYFGAVFALGFLLGVLRVGLLAPRLGELLAVLVELPLILAAAWWVCGRLVVAFRVPASVRDRLVMGGIAFTLLMAAEFGLARVLSGASPSMHLAAMLTPAGLVGLAGQMVFALFPLLRRGCVAA
jgi:hypothetical protein